MDGYWRDIAGNDMYTTAEKAVVIARLQGLVPSKREMEDLKYKTDDKVDRATFEKWTSSMQPLSLDLVMPLFRRFDPQNTGKISNRILKHIMCGGPGEPLDQDEWAHLQKLTNDAEQVDYMALVSLLMQ
ncbi:MAG: uncharacterized protein KVP18_003625 [Porospora cf. gigantea A]|uniref:uncharacterized protein n=2 Tax=Porospora cf. gigantea A TaxID=2853593 RepID=UPI00355A3E2A|nr:MAG: hypothetical protein KVP18_003625 [Porospora cf. gigantea A]